MIEAKITSIDTAYQISARAFLNALMREWSGWSLVEAAMSGPDLPVRTILRLPLASRDSVLAVAMAHVSDVGYHSFRLPFLLSGADETSRPIAFPEAVTLIAAEPGIVGRGGAADAGLVFLRRVLDSAANVDDVLRQDRPSPAVFTRRDPSFAEAEKALRFGHAVHPAPRSRDQFTVSDSRAYAPEYGNGFQLRWWAAVPDAVAQGSSRADSAATVSAALAASDPTIAPRVGAAAREGHVLLPMHPWQAARMSLDPAIEALFRSGRLTDLGAVGSDWFATSSLRAVHAVHADWMLKFSMNLRLTNSERLIKPVECERGLQVDRLLGGPFGQTFAARLPSFRVMGEPAWLALKGADGAVLAQTIAVFRDNPFRGENQPSAAMLAALCEIYPDGRGSALADIVLRIAGREGEPAEAVARRWFAQFLRTVVAPFLVAQAEFGLLFGAHQQNVVVSIEHGWPVGVWFRDCQGTGYVREFLPALREAAPEVDFEAGHIFASREAAQILGYYLVVNGVFAAIAALERAGLASETDLVAAFRALLDELAGQPLKDKTAIHQLRTAPTLGSKGNFMFCFRNVNENTEVTDPLAGYRPIRNPLAEASR